MPLELLFNFVCLGVYHDADEQEAINAHSMPFYSHLEDLLVFKLFYLAWRAIFTLETIEDEDPERWVCNIKFEWALNLSNNNQVKAFRLEHIGDLALELYWKVYKEADLDMAIAAYDAAVQVTDDGHPCRVRLLGQLGAALCQHLEHFGNPAILDKAILVNEHCLKLTPAGQTPFPRYVSNLGNALKARFEHAGDLVDINKAINAHIQAVNLIPDGHEDKPLF